MRQDLEVLRSVLSIKAESEATYLYRLAWRMAEHGCDPKHIEKCRSEARLLHMCAKPEIILDPFQNWKYAFKI